MEENLQSAKPKTPIPIRRWLLITLCTLLFTLFAVRRFNAAKPQLDIRNTGATVLTVRHRGNSLIVQPGQTWHFRFWPGDALTIEAGDAQIGPSRTLVLESRGMVGGMLSRVPVEVKLEGTNISFTYAGAP